MNTTVTQNNNSSGGIGCLGLLTILFIGLKLCGVIDWPWLWVLAPAWIGLCITLLVLGAVAVVFYFATKGDR